MGDTAYDIAARNILGERIGQLRTLSPIDAASLPEASQSEALVLGGKRCSVTVFKQSNSDAVPGAVLVTVLVARSGLLGIASYHTARGLVFFPDGGVRDATELELQNSGG